MSGQLRNYTRWTEVADELVADILGARYALRCAPSTGHVWLDWDAHARTDMSPDEARMLGVRLIEAAALADGGRAIRKASTL